MSVQISSHFFFYWVVFLLVNFESSLYFLDTHSLGDDIPSNSSRLCLSFRAVSFTCQKLHILMISNLSFLHVIFKFLPNLRLQWFSLVFSSRSIIVLTLTFRPTIQLELIFLVKVHILSMNVQSVQCHSLKRFILCPWNCLCTFIKIKWLHVCWYISRQFIFFQSYEF